MKRSVYFAFLGLSLSFLFSAAISQERPQGCQFNITGTWQSSTDGQVKALREHFAGNGVMTELARNGSDQWQATTRSRYKLDDAKKPKTMIVTTMGTHGHAAERTTLEIESLDDGVFVTKAGGEEGKVTRWTRIDPYRYFVVLAAGKGDPGFGAAGFAMLIKTDGVHTQRDALGSYPVVTPRQRYAVFGEISEELRKEFDKEPVNDDGSMLRIEVTAGPYNRALEVLKSWQRRVDEDQVLYPTIPYLNNAVYLNQLTSSLNEAGVLTWKGGTTCAETIKLQKLTWLLSDPIMAKHNLTQTPYYLFKTLRELNAPLHLSDSQFHAALAGEQAAPVAISSR